MTFQTQPDLTRAIAYERRFARVIEHVHAHLDEPLDLDQLADIAALSRWHWHRVWQAVFGESVVAMVRRLRLHRAASALAHGETDLERLAREAGYGSLAAFTRAFRQSYGLPPATYRQEGSHRRFDKDWTPPIPSGADTTGAYPMQDVTIRHEPQRLFASIPHKGPYIEIGRAFEHLIGSLASRGLMGKTGQMFGFYYSDPSVVPEPDLQSMATMELTEEIAFEAPLQRFEMPASRYAVLRHKGPYADMRAAYDWLYGTWLPTSGEELADAPVMEIYISNPRDTAPADILTDICLPLKG
ncbi:AraC family transcriptional regulator [Pannonibacter carbonis]|uniref:AraC family transcriptional regulator n=1 Tax=Pannonibacter carbonis TaxID=2067569 RepID=UPI000D10F89B|nr:AraC family transcriptional regulator [Pannonibacter carbonis]